MGKGSGISIRDRMIVWDCVSKGMNSPGLIKQVFDDADERPISRDSIRRLIKEFEDFKRLLSEYSGLKHLLAGLLSDDRRRLQWIRQHQDDLCHSAHAVLRELLKIHRYMETLTLTIADIYIGSNDPEDIKALEAIDDPQARYLLAHLRSELPRLQNLSSWIDLRVDDIDDELLDRLSLRMSQHSFAGKCPVCEEQEV